MIKKVTLNTILTFLILATVSCSRAGRTESHDNTTETNTSTSIDSPQVIPATAQKLRQVVQSSHGKLIVMNVWATWCQPCREEFPDLVKLYRHYQSQGLTLILVSADVQSELSNVKNFLARQDIDFTTYFKDGNDMDFINGLHRDWSGALPATFIYRPDGALLDFWEGKASYAKLDSTVTQYLTDTTT